MDPKFPLLSPQEVRKLKEARGIDLRVEEAAARRAGGRVSIAGDLILPGMSAAPSSTDHKLISTDKPKESVPSLLPPVGRHTQALEAKTPPRVRKPSIQETPDLKKPKLEAPDADMGTNEAPGVVGVGDVEPGHIDTQSTEPEADVDIPTSPHFATNKIVAHYDLTKEDDEDSPDVRLNSQSLHEPPKINDELAHADTEKLPTAAASALPAASLICNSTASIPNSLQPQPQAAAGLARWAFGATTTPLPSDAPLPAPSYAGVPETMPPWVQEIREGFFGLHNKADQIHQQMCTFGAEIQAHGVRITSLEQVASEHTSKHESSEARIRALENKIEVLIAQNESLASKSDLRSRSPMRTGLGTRGGGGRSPSPRSPRFINRAEFAGQSDDFDVVIGGWSDARKSDAFDEVRNIFRAIDSEDAIEEIWAPFSRTGFAKVTLVFPDPHATLNVKRQFQTQIISKIKSKDFRSGVAGSDGVRIWATKSKTPEERAKIRAVVLTKEFYKTQTSGADGAVFGNDDIEISWAGKVFIDRFQLLGSVDRDGEPRPYDVCIEDAKGNHMNWYIRADEFSKVTGRNKEDLQDLWLNNGPTSAHARADA